MVLVIWEQWKDSIFQQFSSLYNENILTDVILKAGSQKCHVHSFVLSLFSKYLQNLLELARNEKDPELPVNIIFSDIGIDSVLSIINFMYHGQMNIEENLVPEIIYLSKLLQIKGLEDLPTHFADNPLDTSVPICFDNIKDIGELEVEVKDHSDIHEILSNKRFEAEIIPLDPIPNVNDASIEGEHMESIDVNNVVIGFSEDEEMGDSEVKTEKILKIKKKERKPRRSSKKCVTRIIVQEPGKLNVKELKRSFLLVVERYAKEEKASWFLDECDVELLSKMGHSHIGNDKLHKESELLEDTKNVCKLSRTRMRRELSFFWHHMLSLSGRERKRLASGISERVVRDTFKDVINAKKVDDILGNKGLTALKMSTIFLMLLHSKFVSTKTVAEAYKSVNPDVLYKHRVEKALQMYQNSDLFLTDIAEQCWVPYSFLKAALAKRDVKREDCFDDAVQNALRLCGDGVALEDVLLMDKIEQYAQDFKLILEQHMGRDIVLPLAPYEDRIEAAVKAAWEDKTLSMVQAAREHIVSYSTLCKRVLSKEDTDCEFGRTGKSFFYKGVSEPVISSEGTRRGQKSRTDRLIRAALLSCKEGMTPEEAFKVYNIRNVRTQSMIRFNVNRRDVPLDKSYVTRFKNAVDEVNVRRKTINEASRLHLINYSALREYFYIKKNKKRITKKSHLNRNKPRFVDQIEAAIRSIKEGMTIEEAFQVYKFRDKRHMKLLKHTLQRTDDLLSFDYNTRFNMALKAVRSRDICASDAGIEFCVNSSTLRYYEPQSQKVPSKNGHNFDRQMRLAVTACRAGMDIAGACVKFKIKTPKYQDILEFNVRRKDPPLDVPYEERMQKAKEAVFSAEMTLSQATDLYMVSPAVLSKTFNAAKRANIIPKDRLLDKQMRKYIQFDKSIIAAIKSARQGMRVGFAFKIYRLQTQRSYECLKFNMKREDAPLDVPYSQRMTEAVEAVVVKGMDAHEACNRFIVRRCAREACQPFSHQSHRTLNIF